jgi:hypothetical protein
MIFQRCSDVVEFRVEHAILDTESRRNAEFSSVSEQPRRANFRGTPRTSDDHSVQRAGFSIDQLGDLSIASSAAANACHDFVRMELVANPDFHADLCGAVHRSDTPALMLNKYRAEPTKYWLDRDGSCIHNSCRIHLPTWFADLGRKHEPDGL